MTEPHPDQGPRAKILELAADAGVVRPRDLAAYDIHRMTLTRLVDEGLMVRVGWGLYRLTNAEPMGAPDVVLVSARVPGAVIGLVSALSQYGLTLEIPKTVDLLLPRGMASPKMDYPPLRLFRASGDSFDQGITAIDLDGARVPITTPAKTVADCFKFRSRVGKDIALEALREGLNKKRFTPAEFGAAAKVDRVLAVVRPYVESLL